MVTTRPTARIAQTIALLVAMIVGPAVLAGCATTGARTPLAVKDLSTVAGTCSGGTLILSGSGRDDIGPFEFEFVRQK